MPPVSYFDWALLNQSLLNHYVRLRKGKRQVDNSTLINTVSDNGDQFISLIQYSNETQPFTDLFEDANDDGQSDGLEFQFPAEMDTWLNSTGLTTAHIAQGSNSTDAFNFNYTIIMDTSNTFTLICKSSYTRAFLLASRPTHLVNSLTK